jgi:hypothetical protein
VQARIKTQSAFFKRPHLLKAQSHIVHRDLNQETVFWILLELQSIEQCLSFLQQAQRPLELLMRDKMNSAVVQLMQDHRNFVFIQVQLFAVQFLKRVFFIVCQKSIHSIWHVLVSIG